MQVDVNEPAWQPGMSWGGMVRQDPTKHKLWKKRVTFIKVWRCVCVCDIVR